MTVGVVNETLRYAMDYDLFIRLSAHAPVRLIPHQLSVTRIYDETLTKTGGRARYRELKGILRRHTGRRFPPGVAFYGVEYLQFLAERPLRRYKGLPGNERIRSWLQRSMELGSSWVVSLSNDVWPDNWVGRVAEFALPRGDEDVIRISGTLPGELVDESGQELEIRVNAQILDRITIFSTEFEHFCLLPPELRTVPADPDRPFYAHDHVFNVQVRATRHHVPKKTVKNSIDRRRLSWKMTDVSAISSKSVTSTASLGWFEDLWASPVVAITLPTKNSTFRIRGSVPDSHPRLIDQEISFSINGGEAEKIMLGPLGEIDVAISRPALGTFMSVRITSTKYFTPIDEGSGPDSRHLSFILWEAGYE